MLDENELNSTKEYTFHLALVRGDGATIDSPCQLYCSMARAMNLLGIFDEAVTKAKMKKHIKDQMEDLGGKKN